MKKVLIYFFLLEIFVLEMTSTVMAVEYNCGLVENMEFITEVTILDNEGLEDVFGKDFDINCELGDRDKILITEVKEEKLEGKDGWTLKTEEWEYIGKDEEFKNEPDYRFESWIPKNPSSLGKIFYYFEVWVPTLVENYLNEIEWEDNISVSGTEITYKIEKNSSLGLIFNIEKYFEIVDTFDSNTGFEISSKYKNANGDVIFEENTISINNIIFIIIIILIIGLIGVISIVLIYVRKKKISSRKTNINN